MSRLIDPDRPTTGVVVEDNQVLIVQNGQVLKNLTQRENEVSPNFFIEGAEFLEAVPVQPFFLPPAALVPGTTTTVPFNFLTRRYSGGFFESTLPTDRIRPTVPGWYWVYAHMSFYCEMHSGAECTGRIKILVPKAVPPFDEELRRSANASFSSQSGSVVIQRQGVSVDAEYPVYIHPGAIAAGTNIIRIEFETIASLAGTIVALGHSAVNNNAQFSVRRM